MLPPRHRRSRIGALGGYTRPQLTRHAIASEDEEEREHQRCPKRGFGKRGDTDTAGDEQVGADELQQPEI